MVCNRELGILMLYTLEASFFGPEDGSHLLCPKVTDPHMTIADYRLLGRDVISTLAMYLHPHANNLQEYVSTMLK